MQNSNNESNVESLKLRGRSAIEIEHKNKFKEDETRIDIKISNIYRVDLEEAKDIHINYHSDRILFLLMGRANKNIYECALRVAQGELIEMAAVDLLYKELCQEFNGNVQDRYINFYG